MQPINHSELSIVLPAKNEAEGLKKILPVIVKIFGDAEILVVDSGSTDDTADIARSFGAVVVKQPYTYGNGAAVKAGIRAASGRYIVLMDADGQHNPTDIPRLLDKLSEGYDMVVGARTSESQASFGRRLANSFYNRFSSWMTSHRIDDLTSGFRVVKADLAREFLHLLPNGFSYPTTITMAFFRSGFSVGYVSIEALSRSGNSHINLIQDGIRFLLIIFRIGTLYSPLKIFAPVSLLYFCVALGYYMYTYITLHRLTNMTVILFSIAALIFLIGLLSEQITNLHYSIRQQQGSSSKTGIE